MPDAGYASRVRLDNFDPKKGLDRGVGKITEICWYIFKIIFFLSAFPYPQKFKAFLLRLFGAKIGRGVIIKPRVNIHMPWKLEIGDYVWIGEEAFILNFETIKVGNNVCISQRAFLCGGNHDYLDAAMSYKNGPITLEDGCWIGAGCFIGPNVTIGADSIITAYSVATKNSDANGIYKGNPAIFLKSRWK